MLQLKGTVISPGISLGKAFILKEDNKASERTKYTIEDFYSAKNVVKNFISTLMSSLEVQGAVRDILDVQLSILDDPELESQIKKLLDNGVELINAIHTAFDYYVNALANTSEYLRERVIDIRGVEDLLIRALRNNLVISISMSNEDIILIAKELDPIRTIMIITMQNIKGVILEQGGVTSHTAILLRSRGIPAIFNVRGIFDTVKNNDYIILDAYRNIIYVNPDNKIISKYSNIINVINNINEEILKEIVREGLDINYPIRIMANVNNIADLELALHYNANGIGLLRTEFLFFNRSYPPSEDEQFNVYRQYFSRFEPKTIIIRLLDIGGEKIPPYLRIPNERNPQLGLRGVRLLLRNARDILISQIRAIVRAAREVKNSIVILIPMVSFVNEVLEVKKILNDVINDVIGDNGSLITRIKLGAMVETPSAVLQSDVLAEHVDLLSIGTNDLTQYILAVDRESNTVNDMYSQFSPAVLRAIDIVVKNAKKVKKDIEIDVCGELASEPLAVPLLIGLEVDAISVEPPNLPIIYYVLKRLNINEARELSYKALNLSNSDEVIELMKSFFINKNIKVPQVVGEFV
jgi:phosphotransferase system enzyme I (PtsI)